MKLCNMQNIHEQKARLNEYFDFMLFCFRDKFANIK